MSQDQQGPSKLGSLLRFLIGGFLALIGAVGWIQQSCILIAVGFLFAVFCCLGLRWIVLGLLGLAGKSFPRSRTYGAALIGAVLLTLMGPSLSRSFWASEEPRYWNKVKDSHDPKVWHEDYEKAVPQAVRRAEYPSRFAEARAQKAISDKDFGQLRSIWGQLHEGQKEKYDDASRAFVTKAYDTLFQEGLAKIQSAKGADPKLQRGFAELLSDLKKNPTKAIVLDFKFEGGVGSHPADKVALERSTEKVPILPLGDSLAAQAIERRKSQTLKDLEAAFDGVFPKGLLDLEKIPNGVAEQHVRIAIVAKCSRLPGFYVNGKEKNGKFTATDFLYKMSVNWRCQLIGLGGKKLAEFSIDSEPAKSVRYSTRQDDPAWAPYSIILDSASDNFARLVLLKMGMPAPQPKSHYSFQR